MFSYYKGELNAPLLKENKFKQTNYERSIINRRV